MIRLVNAIARAANTALDWLFPTAPDDVMAVAEATAVAITCGTPGPDGLVCDRAKNHDDGIHADSRSGRERPVTWRTPQPPLQNVQGIHPALRSELSDERLAELVEAWSR